MPLVLLRLLGMIWLFGIAFLSATATSTYLFSTENQPERTLRWHARLRATLVWPFALLSPAGRARLRNG